MLKLADIVNKKFVLLVTLFMVSCQKQKIHKEEIKASDSVQELEARFFDLPFPMDVSYSLLKDNTILLEVNGSVDDIISFYKANFEMFGWNQVEEFCSVCKRVFVFQKPNKKICLIIESNENIVKISIIL